MGQSVTPLSEDSQQSDGDQPILCTDGLVKEFDQGASLVDTLFGRRTTLRAVDEVSVDLFPNEVVGIIGESGCGKSTLAEALVGLQEPSDGEIRYRGESTAEFSRRQWKQFRQDVQIVFQDPFHSMDPKMTVRESLQEPLNVHDYDDQTERVRDVLELVELGPPGEYLDSRPHQLSGGEKQRVSLARALVLEPEVIVADEPVSMLDVSTQASILNFLSELTTSMGISMLYISHDLSTVSYVCDTINVMYLGRVVESAPTTELIHNPQHPYTQELINAVPVPNPHYDRERAKLEGDVPDPIGLGEGCRFRDRCPERMDVCEKTPRTVPTGDDESHQAACHLFYDHEDTDD